MKNYKQDWFDEDAIPEWLKKMMDDGDTLYENDHSDYYLGDTDAVEELEDDEYNVTVVAELYDKSDDFICEVEREDVGILCQEEIDGLIERIKDEKYVETVQKEVFDALKYKVLDAFLMFEKRTHSHMIIYFQHKVEQL